MQRTVRVGQTQARITTVFVGAFVALLSVAQAGQGDNPNWPSFRGQGARGVAEGFTTPTAWNASTGEGIKWKTRVAGLGHSSPVIWGNRVYVTTAVSGKKDPLLKVGLYGNIQPVEDDTKHAWRLYCLDKNSGSVLFDKLVHEAVPRIKRHAKATHANSTPAVDGKHLVTFLGSEGLFAFDMDGEALWHKDLGPLDAGYYVVPEAQWGFASSPIIYDGKVIVQCDAQKDSFLAAFDVQTGKKLWRTPRDEVPTWSTPTVHVSDDRRQIIVNGYKHIGGYDLDTGKELWKVRGGGDIPVPTPVVAGDLIYISNAHGPKAPIYAIRTAATGDITLPDNKTSNEHIAWSYGRRGTYMQTLLVYDGLLYACRDNGVLTCYDAKNGSIKYKKRLGSGRTGFTASPVAGDGKIYFTSEEGDVYVVKAGPVFGLMATNALNEVAMATPAISQGRLFFHTKGHVICVGE